MAKHEDLVDQVSLPSGTMARVEPGWWLQKVSTGADGPTDPVRYGQGYLPRTFELDVFPYPNREGDRWMVALLFRVDPDQIALPAVWCAGVDLPYDVPEALDWLRQRRPLSWWRRYAVLAMAGAQAVTDVPADAPDRFDLIGEAAASAAEVPVVRRRDRVTDHLLREVADVYRDAWDAGANPTQAVARHFHKSHSTAARWVGLTRKAGHLGAANGSRGGEKR